MAAGLKNRERIQAGIAGEIAAAESRLHADQEGWKEIGKDAREAESVSGRHGVPKLPGSLPAGTLNPEVRKQLQTRVRHLRQIETWMQADPDLLHTVDQLISNQVRAAQRRQAIFSAGTAILSLVAGWLLSAISPVSALAHLLKP